MTVIISRRGFLVRSLSVSVTAAPAIVTASSLMKLQVPQHRLIHSGSDFWKWKEDEDLTALKLRAIGLHWHQIEAVAKMRRYGILVGTFLNAYGSGSGGRYRLEEKQWQFSSRYGTTSLGQGKTLHESV